jgi:predicted kinase
MHLGNMVLINNKVIIFDGIDFNEHLRWIDVISEVAFVTMDLNDRGHPEFANRFINLYIQHTGDYPGLVLLKYYLVYRAMVRAKVALLRVAQKDISNTEQNSILEEFSSYLALALQYISYEKIALIITHGLSGSGKSTFTEPLLEQLGAIRIRSDVERKRLFGYASLVNTQSRVNEGIYTQKSSKQTYERLAELAKSILSSGFTVIVDACFLQHEMRCIFYNLAEKLHVPFIILDFQASQNVLVQRITDRAKNKYEPSEADLEVLKSQLKKYSPLEKQEHMHALRINTENKVKINEIVSFIKDHLE